MFYTIASVFNFCFAHRQIPMSRELQDLAKFCLLQHIRGYPCKSHKSAGDQALFLSLNSHATLVKTLHLSGFGFLLCKTER